MSDETNNVLTLLYKQFRARSKDYPKEATDNDSYLKGRKNAYEDAADEVRMLLYPE